MAFQVSVTHWFLLTPFCHQAAVVSRRGEGRTAREEGAGAEKMEGIHGASRSRGWRGEWEPQGWPRGLWREDGMKGKGPFWTQAILNPVKSSLHMNLRVANIQRCEHVSGRTEEPEPLPPTSRVTETAARPRLPLLTTRELCHLPPPPVRNPSCLLTQGQPPDASSCIVLFKVLHGKMFYFLCLLHITQSKALA